MWRFLLLLAALVLFAGCVFVREEFYPVKYYDIGNPVPSKFSSASIKTGTFTVMGPYKQEMVFRIEKNELVKDQFNRWAQSPDIMLKRYLKIAFPEAQLQPEYTITGNILVFEAELVRKEVVLVVEYRIESQAVSIGKTATFNVKLEDDSPESVAVAMSLAVADFTESLGMEVKKISGK